MEDEEEAIWQEEDDEAFDYEMFYRKENTNGKQIFSRNHKLWLY
jgi:hypothetical protein